MLMKIAKENNNRTSAWLGGILGTLLAGFLCNTNLQQVKSCTVYRIYCTCTVCIAIYVAILFSLWRHCRKRSHVRGATRRTAHRQQCALKSDNDPSSNKGPHDRACVIACASHTVCLVCLAASSSPSSDIDRN